MVLLVPFLSVAQKRSKKSKNITSNASYEFMIIKAHQILIDQTKKRGANEVLSSEAQLKSMMLSNTKLVVEFDLGPIKSNESQELNRMSRNFKSLSDVVNTAASRGWQFHSSNVVQLGNVKTHYYYMTRDK